MENQPAKGGKSLLNQHGNSKYQKKCPNSYNAALNASPFPLRCLFPQPPVIYPLWQSVLPLLVISPDAKRPDNPEDLQLAIRSVRPCPELPSSIFGRVPLAQKGPLPRQRERAFLEFPDSNGGREIPRGARRKPPSVGWN